jgi:multiple sugar transport system substrate-binding protein
VGGEDVVIMDGSKNKEAAMKWVDYLMTADAQKIMATVGVVPTLSSLTGDPSLPPYFAVFMEQLKTAQARVPSPKWSDMDTAIANAFTRMLKGQQTVQQALDQAADEINALIKQ